MECTDDKDMADRKERRGGGRKEEEGKEGRRGRARKRAEQKLPDSRGPRHWEDRAPVSVAGAGRMCVNSIIIGLASLGMSEEEMSSQHSAEAQ